MNQWPHDNDAELDAFYSRPDGSAKWEVTNLTYIFTPWKAYLAGTTIELTRGIRIHKKVADSLTRIFNALWEQCHKSQAEIEKLDLHQIGGAYYFRARRGSKRLSNHARGIAIDIDPQDNQMRPGNKGDMSMAVISAFEKEGWRWGGVFGDPMHFEAVFNGKQQYFSEAEIELIKKEKAAANAVAREVVRQKRARRKINDATLALVKRFEAFRATQYSDAGHPAIGYGRRDGFRDFKLTPGMVISEEIASAWLRDDLEWLGEQIAPLIKVTLTDNQFGALVSFQYNTGGLAKSTLLKELNVGDFPGAKDQFKYWCKYTNPKTGKKETLPGLLKRRLAEADLFGAPYRPD